MGTITRRAPVKQMCASTYNKQYSTKTWGEQRVKYTTLNEEMKTRCMGKQDKTNGKSPPEQGEAQTSAEVVTYITHLICTVYTVFYTIYCIFHMPHGHRSSIYLCYCTYSYSIVVVEYVRLLVRYYCTVGLKAQAFHYTRINIC